MEADRSSLLTTIRLTSLLKSTSQPKNFLYSEIPRISKASSILKGTMCFPDRVRIVLTIAANKKSLACLAGSGYFISHILFCDISRTAALLTVYLYSTIGDDIWPYRHNI